ncbi:signal peptidase I [Nonomuraea sp. NPDC049695]|uniref:signal peptidase I n=1 Tax=Nonomuraea sp. NPDC049695 TaxID=3154734 RepID=UPI003433AB15
MSLSSGKHRTADHEIGLRARRAAFAIRLIGFTAARAALGVLIGLLTWSQLPALLPAWQAAVILTGSMGPRIMPGDVVVYQHVPVHTLKPGQVVLVRDHSQPTQLLTHRVHKMLANGHILTSGDANLTPDSTSTPPEQVLGLGRIHVPWIGLPVLWWYRARYWTMALGALGLAVLTYLAATPRPRGDGTRPPAEGMSEAPG